MPLLQQLKGGTGQLTWFKVDDSFHHHSKARKVAAKSPAALALWVLAGSWSSANLTEGFVPDDDLPWILPGAEQLAAELVAARLWKRVKGGHQFHDWLDFNPSRQQVLDDRAAARARMRRLRADRKKGSRERSAELQANVRDLFPTPSRTSFRSSGGPRASPCHEHAGQPAHNCASCRSEKLGAS